MVEGEPHVNQPPGESEKQQGKVAEVVEYVKAFFRTKFGRRRELQPPSAQIPGESREEKKDPGQFDKTYAREMLHIAEQGTDDFKILPGHHWALNYPQGAAEKTAAVQRLFEGHTQADDEVINVTPDALIYNKKDIRTRGREHVEQRVQRVVTTHENYDYRRFTGFVSEMQSTSMTPEMAQHFYDMIATDRAKHVMLTTYEQDDRSAALTMMRSESEAHAHFAKTNDPMTQIIAASGIHTFITEGGASFTNQRLVEEAIPTANEALYENFREEYKKYVTQKDEHAYRKVVEAIKAFHDATEDTTTESETPKPPEEEGLVEPPPPSSEYQPPIEKENTKSWFYEIEGAGANIDPYLGYYPGLKSTEFDPNTKEWSKQKIDNPWSATTAGENRYTMKAIAGTSQIQIPVPEGYTLDIDSLRTHGSPQVTRDSNGSFYITNATRGEFTIDFVKVDPPPSVAGASFADGQTIHSGKLSAEAEELIAAMKTDDEETMERAEKLLQFIHTNHVYPADLNEAIAVQQELKNISTAENYIQNLEASRKLECLSANTLFVAMLRHAGVKSRIVTGHMVDQKTENKAVLDRSTAHAWSEVWDGSKWVLMDATPPQEARAQSEEGEDDPGGAPTFDEKGLPSETTGPGEKEIGEGELEQSEQAAKQALDQRNAMRNQMQNADSFKGLDEMRQEIEASEDLFEDMKDALEKMIEAKEEQAKKELKEDIEDMFDDGFIDQEREEELRKQLGELKGEALDELKERIENESKPYKEFQELREEILPVVDEWYDYFVQRLPTEDVIVTDELSVKRRGKLDKHAMIHPGKRMYGKVFHPKTFKPEVRPKFLASIAVDVSVSMEEKSAGDENSTKIRDAKKLVIFYNELFSRISQEYGYIRYSLYSFAKNVNLIKRFDQDYNSNERYDYPDGDSATVKKRMVEKMAIAPYTNMFDALRVAGGDLLAETRDFPDYASSLYYVGDGEENVWDKTYAGMFLRASEQQGGFGNNNVHAIMLGTERQKQVLANTFGEKNTTVASNFDSLIEQAMYKFDDDMQDYLVGKV